MSARVDDALVEGWEDLEAGFTLPGSDDRHVVATAVRDGAHAIVTANLVDFPTSTLGPLGLRATRHRLLVVVLPRPRR
ncbi:hypothetical protein [Frankia sp. EAN1pec]|uniref:hypothetical protein n=1 Tax=Parafrankia sp. (strain EAN1pec) TaxID=298653 RepID=UPI0002D4B461